MCYRKRVIKNPVKDNHRSGFDPVKITTQCGKCPACRKVRANDWFVRAYFEFKNNEKPAYFISLDFDDQHLPRWKGKPCFDSDIIKKFLKRLRNTIGSFRYMYVTEYGGILHRSHYHLMLTPDNVALTDIDIQKAVFSKWQCGSHTDIMTLESVAHNKLAALQYICSYTTKDISLDYNDYDNSEEFIPARYRSRVQASKGFGLQALRDGDITLDMILENKPVNIPCGVNGKVVSFAIPHYYEFKLGYDSVWHSEQLKQEHIKNEIGVKIQMAKHNGRYVYLIRKFFASRFNGLDSGEYFNNLPWYQVVMDCMSDFGDFCEYVYYRRFLSVVDRVGYVYDLLRNQTLYRPYWRQYEMAFSIFEAEQKRLDNVNDVIQTHKLVEAAKRRARNKILRNPRLRSYLERKEFDFNKLIPKSISYV